MNTLLSSKPQKKRRTRIPDKPHRPINLWPLIRKFIGMELSTISMPVNFSEPLSLLQRLTECLEYSHLLDQAAEIEDSCDQLPLVAAFVVSTYSSTAIRTQKPFNSLLGETYECDRTDDLGWRSISEQVSHHPPISVLHVESNRGW